MLNIKKYVSLFLVLLLLLSNSFVLAQETPTEITFENSLYVETYSQTQLTFTPEDFPGVDCKRVVILCKDQYEDRYGSSLLLILNQSGKQAKAEATEKLKQFPFVTSVIENIYAEPYVKMDTAPIFLKRGETVTVEYYAGGAAWLYDNHFYGTFEVDPGVFDESAFTQDSFAHFGIMDYWPLTSDAVWKSKPFPFEFSVSPYHRYCTSVYFGSKGNGFEIADALARTPGITMVEFFGSEAGGRYAYKFENNTPDVFELNDQWNPQEITVTGKTTGQGTFSFLAGGTEQVVRDVFVYELGNVNSDTKIDAKDALMVLKYAVQKMELTQAQQKAAEVDGKDGINAKDALEILKYSVRKITKFPIEEIVITPTDVTPTDK